VLPPDDDSISKYICPKYMKRINIQDKSAKSTAKTFVATQGGERATKTAKDLRNTGDESATKKIVKFDEK
jgi:hypothetical protein